MADDYHDRMRDLQRQDQLRQDQMRDLQRQDQLRQDHRREDIRRDQRREDYRREDHRREDIRRDQRREDYRREDERRREEEERTPSWPRETAGRQPPSIAPLGNSSMGSTNSLAAKVVKTGLLLAGLVWLATRKEDDPTKS